MKLYENIIGSGSTGRFKNRMMSIANKINSQLPLLNINIGYQSPDQIAIFDANKFIFLHFNDTGIRVFHPKLGSMLKHFGVQDPVVVDDSVIDWVKGWFATKK